MSKAKAIILATLVVCSLAVLTRNLVMPPASVAPLVGGGLASSRVPSPANKNSLSSTGLLQTSFRLSHTRVDPDLEPLVQEINRALTSTNLAGREIVFTSLLGQLVERNPRGAGRLGEALEPTQGRAEVLNRVAHDWAAQDPSEALEWAAQLPETDERNSALIHVCFKVLEQNPAGAIEIAERYNLTHDAGVIENLVQAWATTDVSAALAWASEHSAGEPRDQLFARIAVVQAQTTPADAANLVAQQIAPGPLQAEAALSVLHQWAPRDLAAAAAWSERFPEGSLHDRANHELTDVRRSQEFQSESK